MEIINLCFAADNNYAKPLVLAILSILNRTQRPVSIHILDGEISPENKKKLNKIARKYNAQINYYSMNEEDFSDCPITGYVDYISKSTYFRFLIPEKINVDKLLYLDCDILCLADIAELFDLDLGDALIGGVPEVFNHLHQEQLEFPKEEFYINGGVLLINNKKWKEENICQKLFEYLKEPAHKIIFQDQDIINDVLRGKKKFLPLIWNVQHDITLDESYLYHQEERIQAMKSPALAHYTNKRKPWLPQCPNPYAKLYRQEQRKYFETWDQASNLFYKRVKNKLGRICRYANPKKYIDFAGGGSKYN